MCISAILIINRKGEIVISRFYRRVSMSKKCSLLCVQPIDRSAKFSLVVASIPLFRLLAVGRALGYVCVQGAVQHYWLGLEADPNPRRVEVDVCTYNCFFFRFLFGYFGAKTLPSRDCKVGYFYDNFTAATSYKWSSDLLPSDTKYGVECTWLYFSVVGCLRSVRVLRRFCSLFKCKQAQQFVSEACWVCAR